MRDTGWQSSTGTRTCRSSRIYILNAAQTLTKQEVGAETPRDPFPPQLSKGTCCKLPERGTIPNINVSQCFVIPGLTENPALFDK